ncbi:MAG: response regulator transcription factor [Kiritimatiellae bacterium]|nr:response regulator transcription factor [Kiritimatiellia bacterium]
MSTKKILVVEDDPSIRRVITLALKSGGFFKIEEAATGDSGLEAAFRFRPDLILLDIMLPGMDGIAVCKALKANPETASCPVVMLTAKDGERDIVEGLDSGANDYVTKPFSKDVLLARIRAALRTVSAESPDSFSGDGLSLDNTTHRVLLDGTELRLTLTEYRILELLLAHPGRVFERASMIDRISGGEKTVTERTIDVQMVGLRRKLGPWAHHIETIRGVGYRLDINEIES